MPHVDADRPLRIGVDGRELIGRPTGVGRYIREVLHAWVTDPAWPHALVVFTPADPPKEVREALGPRVTWHVVPSAHAGSWWEQRKLPAAVRREAIDVFFAGAYTAPRLLPCPFVLAVHDLSYFAHPEWFGWREGLRRRSLTRVSARRAHTITTLSEFSAGEIVRWLQVPRDRIVIASAGAPPRRPSRDAARSRTVLFVGSLFNRRLIPELIAGFALTLAAVPDAHLVLAGDNRTRPRIDPDAIAARHGIAGRVEWREYVADEELARLYGTARAFAFLSAYEGFALTPLEALASGVPPVLLDTPVAREIYGAGAVFTSSDPTSIGAALATLLTDDAARRHVLEAGDGLLDRYSWTHTAAVIRTALERAARPS